MTGRVAGIDEAELHGLIDPLLAGPLDVVSVTARHAWAAARLRRDHYRRRDQAVSLADCMALAACGRGDRLATGDRALLTIAQREGIGVIELAERSR